MKDISEKLKLSEIVTPSETRPEDAAHQKQTGKESAYNRRAVVSVANQGTFGISELVLYAYEGQ